MPMPERCSYRLPSEFRYLLHAPGRLRPNPVALIALHGYGSNPEVMLRLTTAAVGTEHPIASLEAPNQFYIHAPGGDVGYNWGVSAHHASNVALHHEIVLFITAAMQARFGIPPSRCILIGFSQACGPNYRFLATHPGRVGGAIALCGGVPHDWETGPFADVVPSPVLQISRDADEFYPLDKVLAFPGRLRRRIADVEFHLLPGGHRFPSKGGPVMREWLATRFQV
jgi:predicted esterase